MAASESDSLIDQSEPLSAEELGKEMDDLLLKESVSTSAVLDGLGVKPKSKSKISIPLCRMISLPVVRPFLKNDVMGIGQDFVRDGYMDGRGVFYVAIHDNVGKSVRVIDSISDSWSPLWVEANKKFET